MKTSWEQITIADYESIENIKGDNDLDVNLQVLAILMGITKEEIYSMPLNQTMKYFNKLSFLENKPNFKKKISKIKIDDIECNIETNLDKFTMAQYIDYQAQVSNPDVTTLLSIFIIPKGKKYNEGYDIEEFRNKIKNNINIIDAQSIAFFLFKKLISSTKRKLIYLKAVFWMMKITKWKNKETRENLQKIITQMEDLISMFGYLFSTK